MSSPALQMRKQRPSKVMKLDPSLHHPVLIKQNPQPLKGQLRFVLTPKPRVPDHCVICLWVHKQSESPLALYSKWDHSPTFQRAGSQREWWFFFFIQVSPDLCPEWRNWAALGFWPVSVVVFPLTVTDPSWDTTDLILQNFKCTGDKLGASANVQTSKRCFLVKNVYPSQAWTECNVGVESRRNYLACSQVFLIATSFNFSPLAWPNHRRRQMPGKPWILLRKPLSSTVNGAMWIRSLVRWLAIIGHRNRTRVHMQTHTPAVLSALGPQGICGSSLTQSQWGTYIVKLSNKVIKDSSTWRILNEYLSSVNSKKI